MMRNITLENDRTATTTEKIEIHIKTEILGLQTIDITEMVNPKTKHQGIVGTNRDKTPTVETNHTTEIEEITIDVNQGRTKGMTSTHEIEDSIREMTLHPTTEGSEHLIDRITDTTETMTGTMTEDKIDLHIVNQATVMQTDLIIDLVRDDENT